MTSGAEASNPTTSSMPASSGSAMVKPLETSPTTISFAGMPLCSRYARSAWTGWIVPGPGLVVGVGRRRCRPRASLGRVDASAARSRSRRTAGSRSSRRRRSSRVSRAEIVAAATSLSPWKADRPGSPARSGAVTIAIAAAASRGVSGVPATWPHDIEPETSRPSSVRLPAGSTLRERLVEGRVEGVDERRDRLPGQAPLQAAAAACTSAAASRIASGCSRDLRMCSPSASRSRTVRVGLEQRLRAGRRPSSWRGCAPSPSAACPRAAPPRPPGRSGAPSGRTRGAGRPRGSAGRLGRAVGGPGLVHRAEQRAAGARRPRGTTRPPRPA